MTTIISAMATASSERTMASMDVGDLRRRVLAGMTR
jgi:hypothetical protein